MPNKELIPHLFRTEYRKIISVLCSLFGPNHIELAEDLTNDTFLLATETWGLKGVPDNPKAWLYTVAKNKTRDYFRRNRIFKEKVAVELKNGPAIRGEPELDLSEENIEDSQLQMLFAVCNPVNTDKSQIALALRILCGFGIDEIANALLSSKASINKTLFRAKSRLREFRVDLSFPSPNGLDARLGNVLSIIYLLFNEGYYSTAHSKGLSKELCLEAMRLLHLLTENERTDLPEANALMALFCFHASRFEARTNAGGEQVLYREQDRSKWDFDLIEQGERYLNRSAKGYAPSKYHLEAIIAFWHTRTACEPKEKWDSILQCYNRLLQIDYSPITTLNRTYALAMAQNKETAIKEALKIDLDGNPQYHILLAELYHEVDTEKEIEHLNLALKLTENAVHRKLLQEKLERISL